MSDTADAIAYKADVPHRMQDAVGDKVDQVKSAITGTVDQARNAISRTNVSGAVNAVRENPLGLFFGTVAVGFVIGSLLPLTPLEDERLGPAMSSINSSMT